MVPLGNVRASRWSSWSGSRSALTPAELVEFGNEIDELMLRWRRREIPDDGAPDRLEVLAFARAFPSQP